jgi:hypothetical protein
MVPPTTKRELQ